MTDRTPGPWRKEHGWRIVNADGYLIVNGINAGVPPETPYGYAELAACTANAEFIVRACNAHDALVEVRNAARALAALPYSQLVAEMEAAEDLAILDRLIEAVRTTQQ